jgi:hypothetical protein
MLTPKQKAEGLALVRAGVHPSVALRRVLRGVELKPGRDVATMADNAVLTMRRHGLSKREAMHHALIAGGYRPPMK